jgi:hypothetical protein
VTRSNKLFLLIVCIPVLAFLITQKLLPKAQAGEVMNQQFLMEVSITRSTNGTALDIRLTSKVAKPIRVYKSSLPWAAWHSMVLVAVKANRSGEVLEKLTPVDDPGPTVIVLNSGESIKGRVDLNERFPGLSQSVRDSDVLLFWSYQLFSIGGAPFERQGGWLLIPKSPE